MSSNTEVSTGFFVAVLVFALIHSLREGNICFYGHFITDADLSNHFRYATIIIIT